MIYLKNEKNRREKYKKKYTNYLDIMTVSDETFLWKMPYLVGHKYYTSENEYVFIARFLEMSANSRCY